VKPLFTLGHVVATPGALAAIGVSGDDLSTYLARHQSGDWGDIDMHDRTEIAEAAGVSLQLSGHTHLGQFIPWSWMARRIYRQFVYGLSRIGKMQIFTSSGAGTWGPPLRLGSNPEIVVLEFK
jgi:hypothetical protein